MWKNKSDEEKNPGKVQHKDKWGEDGGERREW